MKVLEWILLYYNHFCTLNDRRHRDAAILLWLLEWVNERFVPLLKCHVFVNINLNWLSLMQFQITCWIFINESVYLKHTFSFIMFSLLQGFLWPEYFFALSGEYVRKLNILVQFNLISKWKLGALECTICFIIYNLCWNQNWFAQHLALFWLQTSKNNRSSKHLCFVRLIGVYCKLNWLGQGLNV